MRTKFNMQFHYLFSAKFHRNFAQVDMKHWWQLEFHWLSLIFNTFRQNVANFIVITVHLPYIQCINCSLTYSHFTTRVPVAFPSPTVLLALHRYIPASLLSTGSMVRVDELPALEILPSSPISLKSPKEFISLNQLKSGSGAPSEMHMNRAAVFSSTIWILGEMATDGGSGWECTRFKHWVHLFHIYMTLWLCIRTCVYMYKSWYGIGVYSLFQRGEDKARSPSPWTTWMDYPWKSFGRRKTTVQSMPHNCSYHTSHVCFRNVPYCTCDLLVLTIHTLSTILKWQHPLTGSWHGQMLEPRPPTLKTWCGEM